VCIVCFVPVVVDCYFFRSWLLRETREGRATDADVQRRVDGSSSAVLRAKVENAPLFTADEVGFICFLRVSAVSRASFCLFDFFCGRLRLFGVVSRRLLSLTK
jgi:hypothetical protein